MTRKKRDWKNQVGGQQRPRIIISKDRAVTEGYPIPDSPSSGKCWRPSTKTYHRGGACFVEDEKHHCDLVGVLDYNGKGPTVEGEGGSMQ